MLSIDRYNYPILQDFNPNYLVFQIVQPAVEVVEVEVWMDLGVLRLAKATIVEMKVEVMKNIQQIGTVAKGWFNMHLCLYLLN